MASASSTRGGGPVWVAHADALTCLGSGRPLRHRLHAGGCGLRKAAEAYPGVDAVASAGKVGVVPGVDGEIRLPQILARCMGGIVPPPYRHAELVVGASSLGDLAGEDAGQPRQALLRALALAWPGVALPPVHLVSSACSSGTDALIMATQTILAGAADVVAVIGFDSLGPGKLVQHIALGTQSPDAAHPFDQARDGTSFGEGAAVMLLCSPAGLKRAGLRACAWVAGFGMSSDAHDIVAPLPGGRFAAAAVHAAMDGIAPAQVGYVNAHGSGTPLNDAAETAALYDVFGACGNERIHLGGIKGAVGHTLGACGVVESVVTVHALADGLYPPTAGMTCPDPALALQPALAARARHPREHYAMSLTCGFGGVNSALLFGAP